MKPSRVHDPKTKGETGDGVEENQCFTDGVVTGMWEVQTQVPSGLPTTKDTGDPSRPNDRSSSGPSNPFT